MKAYVMKDANTDDGESKALCNGLNVKAVTLDVQVLISHCHRLASVPF